ncbi:MAG: hypothetical protein KDE46_01325 [Caldilineaceae bacterium]|nr:hypothetical protein [Caldilineaceae bacterium]
MAVSQNFPQLLQDYLFRRFGEGGNAGVLAKSVNEKFSLEDDVGIKRQSINNWLNGTVATPRDWWPIAAITCVLCKTEEEANLLLSAAGLQSVASKRAELEQKVLMDELTRERVEAQVIAHWDEKAGILGGIGVTTPQIASHKSNLMLLLIGGCILLVGVLAYLLWPPPTEQSAPNIADDFSNQETCVSAWNFGEAQYTTCENEAGVLRFAPPVNDTGDWYADIVDSARTGDFIVSRVNFTALLEPASTGRIGVGTDCHDENSWLTVHIDGTNQNVAAAYGQDDEENSSTMTFSSVTLGEEHNINLIWRPGGIEVTIDGVVQERAIPCSQTRWLYIFAGGDDNTQSQGYVTDIRIWD